MLYTSQVILNKLKVMRYKYQKLPFIAGK